MREEVIYEGYVKTYNGQVTLFTYDYPTQGIDLQEQAMGQPAPPPVNNQGAYDNQGGYGYQNGNNNYNSQPPAAQQSTQAQDNSNWQPSAGPVASPVSDPITTEGKNKLARLKKKVDTKITDTDKMAAVKEGLKTEMINCAQIAVIMDWFNFESTKVEFAEWSYDRVTDKEHFSEVREKLAYNSYRDELDKFLQGKK